MFICWLSIKYLSALIYKLYVRKSSKPEVMKAWIFFIYMKIFVLKIISNVYIYIYIYIYRLYFCLIKKELFI